MIRSPNHIALRRERAVDPSPEEIRQYCRELLEIRAINESTRREHIVRRNSDIYRLIERKGPMTVIELANVLGYTKRVVINFLNDQIAAGKIERTGRGNMPFYSLVTKEDAADEIFADLPSSDAILSMLRQRARQQCNRSVARMSDAPDGPNHHEPQAGHSDVRDEKDLRKGS